MTGVQTCALPISLPGLAINLSASSLLDGGFRSELSALLGRHAAVASRLWLEVSEFGAMAALEPDRSIILKYSRLFEVFR